MSVFDISLFNYIRNREACPVYKSGSGDWEKVRTHLMQLNGHPQFAIVKSWYSILNLNFSDYTNLRL